MKVSEIILGLAAPILRFTW